VKFGEQVHVYFNFKSAKRNLEPAAPGLLRAGSRTKAPPNVDLAGAASPRRLKSRPPIE
jgi:hypothetical protein